MVSVCLPSDALLQHLPSYLGFSYLGRRVSLHSYSSKAQPLLLTLDKGYLLTAALPDLQRGIAPLGPPVPTQPRLLGRGVAPLVRSPWPWTWNSSYWLPSLTLDVGSLLSSMNQGKLEVVKQDMARMNIDILGISELKWTGMGEFNSDDHYISRGTN